MGSWPHDGRSAGGVAPLHPAARLQNPPWRGRIWVELLISATLAPPASRGPSQAGSRQGLAPTHPQSHTVASSSGVRPARTLKDVKQLQSCGDTQMFVEVDNSSVISVPLYGLWPTTWWPGWPKTMQSDCGISQGPGPRLGLGWRERGVKKDKHSWLGHEVRTHLLSMI